MQCFTAGVVQLDTGAVKQDNLSRIEALIAQAARQSALLISLPETMNIIAPGQGAESSEPIPGPTTDFLSAVAKRYGLWIHGGSMWERSLNGKPFNTTALIGPDGKVLSTYRKLHLFDVQLGDGPGIRESNQTAAGNEIVTVPTPIGHFGLSICYDLRFPELYRLMALAGAQILFVPANFTSTTGKAHWEVLLRARAIENSCYIIAAAQCGDKPGYRAYANSMIVDPWGEVLAQLPQGEGVITAEIDLAKAARARAQIPALQNRRADVYALTARNGGARS